MEQSICDPSSTMGALDQSAEDFGRISSSRHMEDFLLNFSHQSPINNYLNKSENQSMSDNNKLALLIDKTCSSDLHTPDLDVCQGPFNFSLGKSSLDDDDDCMSFNIDSPPFINDNNVNSLVNLICNEGQRKINLNVPESTFDEKYFESDYPRDEIYDEMSDDFPTAMTGEEIIGQYTVPTNLLHNTVKLPSPPQYHSAEIRPHDQQGYDLVKNSTPATGCLHHQSSSMTPLNRLSINPDSLSAMHLNMALIDGNLLSSFLDSENDEIVDSFLNKEELEETRFATYSCNINSGDLENQPTLVQSHYLPILDHNGILKSFEALSEENVPIFKSVKVEIDQPSSDVSLPQISVPSNPDPRPAPQISVLPNPVPTSTPQISVFTNPDSRPTPQISKTTYILTINPERLKKESTAGHFDSHTTIKSNSKNIKKIKTPIYNHGEPIKSNLENINKIKTPIHNYGEPIKSNSKNINKIKSPIHYYGEPSTSISSASSTQERQRRIIKPPAKYDDSQDPDSSEEEVEEEDILSYPNMGRKRKASKFSLKGLSDAEKYQRIRQQNNVASKKCRENKKKKMEMKKFELDREEARHRSLLDKCEALQRKHDMWSCIYTTVINS